MAVYTVYAPPHSAPTRLESAERFVLVRDRFSWPAFWFGPIWMLWHRLWLALLGYLVLILGLEVAVRLTGGSGAASLQRLKLQRRGFALCGVVVGDDLEAAERRFFSALTGVAKDPRPLPAPGPPAQTGVPDVIGLFPHPGVRS